MATTCDTPAIERSESIATPKKIYYPEGKRKNYSKKSRESALKLSSPNDLSIIQTKYACKTQA